MTMVQEIVCRKCGTRNWLPACGGPFKNEGTCEGGCSPYALALYWIRSGERVYQGVLGELYGVATWEAPA